MTALSSTLIVSTQNTRYIRFRDEDPGQRMSHYYIAAISRYIQKNFTQDTTATPVELHLTGLHITSRYR